jgi:hypothetical protein
LVNAKNNTTDFFLYKQISILYSFFKILDENLSSSPEYFQKINILASFCANVRLSLFLKCVDGEGNADEQGENLLGGAGGVVHQLRGVCHRVQDHVQRVPQPNTAPTCIIFTCKHRLNKYGGRSLKFIWAPCHVMCTAVLIG